MSNYPAHLVPVKQQLSSTYTPRTQAIANLSTMVISNLQSLATLTNDCLSANQFPVETVSGYRDEFSKMVAYIEDIRDICAVFERPPSESSDFMSKVKRILDGGGNSIKTAIYSVCQSSKTPCPTAQFGQIGTDWLCTVTFALDGQVYSKTSFSNSKASAEDSSLRALYSDIAQYSLTK
jgi:hypothetical protein